MAAVSRIIAKNNKKIHQPVEQRDILATQCKIKQYKLH